MSLLPLASERGQASIVSAINGLGGITLNNAVRAEIAERNAVGSEARAATSANAAEVSKQQANSIYNSILQQYGYPFTASTAAGMTDTDKIYVYTGSEAGYTNGNWYYYNGSNWVSGGVFNAAALNTDKTLSVVGAAADAEVTGYYVRRLDGEIKKGYTEVPYLSTADLSSFTSVYGNIYTIGMKVPFAKGYIKSVSMKRAESASDDVVAVFITDLNRKILKKISGEYSGTEIEIPVNEYVDEDFYVFVKCDKLRYGVVDTESREWYQYSFNDCYTTQEGSVMPGDWRETTAAFSIDIAVNMVSVEDIAIANKKELDDVCRTGEVGQPILEQIALNSLTGVNLVSNSFEYPAGYVKTIKLNFTADNINAGRVLIVLINKALKVMKKVVTYRQAGAGYQAFNVDYNAEEPFYVATYAPTLAWQTSSANPTRLKYWSGYFETYAYVREGEELFAAWTNPSTPIKLDIVAVYDYKARVDVVNYTNRERLYTLQDAFSAWMFGEKFPIVFLGDSTTDGSSTTGHTPNVIGTDHQDPNTYTTVLQADLRTALENSSLRIYNAGFSGRSAEWAIQNLDEILWNNSYYNDAKIVCISFGINDYAMDNVRYGWYKDCMEQLVIECFNHNVQPVMVTTQAGMENKTRYGWMQMSLADKMTAEIAQKYNLELINKNKFTAMFNVYSNVPITSIIPDGCHYSDAGHKFEAGMFFAKLVPFTVWSGAEKTILGFANENLRTELEYSSYEGYIWKDVQPLTPSVQGFKLGANCSKNAATVLMDYWVFITEPSKVLTSYCMTPNVQSVSIDGTSYAIVATQQELATLGMGLHHIVVTSGASANVNYLGLTLE